MQEELKKICQCWSQDATLFDASANWKSFRHGAIKLDSCLHVLLERYKDGKQRFRAAQLFEYVIQAGPGHRIEGFCQVYENHIQRA